MDMDDGVSLRGAMPAAWTAAPPPASVERWTAEGSMKSLQAAGGKARQSAPSPSGAMLVEELIAAAISFDVLELL
eukprot:7058383-Pyramimonas_sp.AAC.1